MNETQEQLNNSKPWLYKKGQSGNPGGRPKGTKSMKTYIRERFESMTDDEREEFLEGLPKEIIWKMGEGNPETKSDVTSGGEKIMFLPSELINKHGITSSTKDDSIGQPSV